MKVRWIAEPRTLAPTQEDVSEGSVVDLDDADARSFIEQGLAEPVATAAPAKRKED